MGKPAAEVEIHTDMARRLLCGQHPDLAHLPLIPVESGWDNALFRLGDQLAMRMPRRALAAQLIKNEQRWLPALRSRLPLEVPTLVRTGVPQDDYPWAWSITSWIPGDTADRVLPDRNQGKVLAAFFDALHRPAPAAAPRNPYRGVPLAARAADFGIRRAELMDQTDLIDARVIALWEDGLAAPAEFVATWIHGDLHPGNVLVIAGRLTAVIDWGDLAQGDAASDLAAIWMLLPDRSSRERAMAACSPVAADTWRRARGWAVLYAVIMLRAGLTNDARMAGIAEQTLRRLVAGP